MISLELEKKQIAIVSNDVVIFTAISENSSYDIKLISAANFEQLRDSQSALDLLIVDTEIDSKIIPWYKINAVINLTDEKLLANEVNFSKPLKLEKLLGAIASIMNDEHIFVCINQTWVYSQSLSKISSLKREISLTSRENDLVATLLMSKNFSATKNFLKSEIWKYHQDSETTTVDIHLYKLKNKLPEGMLEIKSNECSLHI
jgi:hypothetical protein